MFSNAVISDMVKKYVASKPVNYFLTVGNVVSDMNLNSDGMTYDDCVGTALSKIHRRETMCGNHTLVVVDTSRKYSRRGNMKANLYQVIGV